MMKRYILSIVLGFFTMTNFSFGQVEIIFESENANTNGTVDIDIMANGFTDISVLQFSAGWDSLVMTFNSVVFTNPDLPDLMPSSIGSPQGSANVDEGQFSFSYGNPVGNGNVPDGATLFTVRFDIVGEECDETDIVLTDDPTEIDAYDAAFEQLTVSSQPGTIMINGADCGGGGGDDLTFTAAMVTVEPGEMFCVPITVENFIEIQTGTGTILWDPEVVSYTGLANIALAGLGGMLNETNTDNGELKFIWSNPDPANPVTLDDGATVFEIWFEAVGDIGDMSPITLSTQGSLGFEWGNDDVNELPLDLNDGKVTIAEPMVDPFTLNVSDVTINQENSNVCVDISVENFDNILSMQYVIQWDASVFANPMPDNFNLDALNGNSFNIDGNCATFSWNANSGIDVPDGTVIYSMCFDYIGECDSSGDIELISKGSTNIEIVDGNTNTLSNVSLNAGSVTLDCETMVDCQVLNVDDTCPGELGGNITVDVPTDNGCTYSWANSGGTEVATTQNLLGVGAGTYFLTVVCGGEEVCTLEATVENIPDLDIDADVNDAGCGNPGSISVTVSLGSGNYSYNWNPSQNNSPNITGLDAGNYDLTVTDGDTGCTQTASYTITNDVEDLEIASSMVSDETCLLNDGRISLTIDGGCSPYTFAWSDSSIGNTPVADNLTAGTYSVTVTDNSSPQMTATAEFMVEEDIATLDLDGASIIVNSSGSDGSITINVTGGMEPYQYEWSPAGLPNSNMITGLAPGVYNVVVTDANGCQATFGPFDVIEIVIGDEPSLINVEADNNENGFALTCNGDMNGQITGNVNGGELPITLTLSGDASETVTIDNLGSFSFTGLSAGTYTVTASNDFGDVSVEDIELTEPDALVVTLETGCDSDDQCDGFIDVNASGGFGDYSYDWGMNSELMGTSVDGLCEGSYTVFVSDENGCEVMRNVNIEPCEGPIDPACYLVRDVITPNGDGMNDQFAVTCITDFPASLEIYDRWGELVFNQDVYDGTWMGISNSNEELIEGGYMYIININFGQGRREIMKGTVTILRN